MEPKVSVVIAIRNAESTLSEALSSILQQSLPPREILAVLNGCSDASSRIVSDFAAQDRRIRILESAPSGGVAEAARLGCQEASCPLIARMDADDVAHEERLMEQCALLLEKEADLVTSHIRCLDSRGAGLERFVSWANGLTRPEDFRRERFVESPVIQPGVLMTREAYFAAGEYRVQRGPEDYDLWLRMLANGARFFQARKAVVDWRDSPTRLTRSHEDYSEIEMTTTKATYLAKMERVRRSGVLLAGSGPIGRRLAKLLVERKVLVHGFFDVAPRKIGKTALGFPIWGPGDLGEVHREATLLGCVGRGGRERVREMARSAGYYEGEDFFACC